MVGLVYYPRKPSKGGLIWNLNEILNLVASSQNLAPEKRESKLYQINASNLNLNLKLRSGKVQREWTSLL